MKIINPFGLAFNFLENGALSDIVVDPIRISLKPSTLFSRPGANVYLRKKSSRIEFMALQGPDSRCLFTFKDNAFFTRGSWQGLEYTCALILSEKSLSWQWTIDVNNTTGEPADLDVVLVQDVALKPVQEVLVNEYYVSQYLERRILHDTDHGAVICCRQNMKGPTGYPWLMLASGNHAVAGSTDGMQFYGRTYRETGVPEGLLAESPGGEYAGESSVVALQEQPFFLAAGESHRSIFVATYLPDHPGATSKADLERLPGLLQEFGSGITSPITNNWISTANNYFNEANFLPADELTHEEIEAYFGPERSHEELSGGKMLSFFTPGYSHVLLKAKEILVDRPHGHIMQAKGGLTPDESMMSTTAFAFGVFNSHLTQGNTNFNTLLSICTTQFNQSPETGQRIFVEIDGRYFLLGVPSAFEMGLNHCRWIYRQGDHCFQVRTWTSQVTSQVNLDFKVLQGSPVKLLITHDFDQLNSWKVVPGSSACESIAIPGSGSMIASRFPGARFRIVIQESGANCRARGGEALSQDRNDPDGSLFVLEVGETNAFCMSFVGEVTGSINEIEIEDADYQLDVDKQTAIASWRKLSQGLSLETKQEDIAAIREILPWYGMNALVHYLTPYGLEQFGGAAWGTRDVSQGPIDLLLSLEKYAEAREVLKIIFSNQNPDGGWPQWWMFDSYYNIRAHEAHGDIFYWCIIALSNYIRVTGDQSILEEDLPFYHEEGIGSAEIKPLSEHVDRLVKMIQDSFLPGTALVPFGGGDWNDSLQPVSQDLARKMISAWTVEMNYQAFMQYKSVYELTGEKGKAEEMAITCERIRADFNKYLVRDGVVAGYGLMEDDGSINVLLHPSDTTTGIKYSILPMERGILSGIFTKDQAELHHGIIEQNLKGPDGARLMDRPLKYRGGIQTIFQRAESSTFFGREIGLMYVHEHIRYAESLAIMGRAEDFIRAMRQAIPVGYRDIVPQGDFRQSNCYYSSSDVVFKNRYEADERYPEVIKGEYPLKGGWRVYSSGPGIYVSLVITRLLGIRQESKKIIIDPVMPLSFDGLEANITLKGKRVTFSYLIGKDNFGPKSIEINGKPVSFDLEENKYRKGGATISSDHFFSLLDREQNIVKVTL